MLRGTLSLAMFCLVAVGCDGENPVAPTGPPQSLEISWTTRLLNNYPPGAPIDPDVPVSETATLALGVTTQLAAIARFSDGSSQDVSDQSIWETSDSAVVTVSGTGLLTTVGYGAAEVTARFQGLTASEVVSVTPPPP